MENRKEISYQFKNIGSIEIICNAPITYEKNNSRIFLIFSGEVYLKWLNEATVPFLDNINGFFYALSQTDISNKELIGKLFSHRFFRPAKPEQNLSFELICEITIADLIFYETFRQGKEPFFEFSLNYHLYSQIAGPDVYSSYIGEIFEQSIKLQLLYDQNRWLDLINRLQLFQCQLFEISLPMIDDPQFAHISGVVSEAVRHFNEGGPMGWKNCVASVRNAFDEWEKAENQTFIDSDLKKNKENTRAERWKLFAVHLRHLTHEAHHGITEFSRAEAQAVLTGFLNIWQLRDGIIKKENSR